MSVLAQVIYYCFQYVFVPRLTEPPTDTGGEHKNKEKSGSDVPDNIFGQVSCVFQYSTHQKRKIIRTTVHRVSTCIAPLFSACLSLTNAHSRWNFLDCFIYTVQFAA
jgi:hypothetical protein